MADYQNLFTSVQAVGPTQGGVALPRADSPRTGKPVLFHLLGRFGNALLVNGELNNDAVWYYADPKPQAEEIRGRVAFWKGVKVIE